MLSKRRARLCATGVRFANSGRPLGQNHPQPACAPVLLPHWATNRPHGYQLRARLRDALGPLGDAMNAGQVYVTLTRLEKAGLLAVERPADGADRSDRKVYALTPTANSESPSGSPR
ncbi:PadR family transcriptional regulator [Nonomuraea sp. 3N208]|uniref:PadR family transcriptional regulator n=1 Tax=Nonomuraea sp. 3N208 TaxID=3457421 RepID=UPI003FD53A84